MSILWNFHRKKLMRYRELCFDAQNPSKSFQNKCHSVYFETRTNWKQALRRKWFTGVRGEWTKGCSLTIPAFRDWSANAHLQSKITSKNSQKTTKTLLQWNENTFLHWRHAFTPKDFQMHQQSLDHSYCKQETSLTKLKNSESWWF
jgi:hypothetical protein